MSEQLSLADRLAEMFGSVPMNLARDVPEPSSSFEAPQITEDTFADLSLTPRPPLQVTPYIPRGPTLRLSSPVNEDPPQPSEMSRQSSKRSWLSEETPKAPTTHERLKRHYESDEIPKPQKSLDSKRRTNTVTPTSIAQYQYKEPEAVLLEAMLSDRPKRAKIQKPIRKPLETPTSTSSALKPLLPLERRLEPPTKKLKELGRKLEEGAKSPKKPTEMFRELVKKPKESAIEKEALKSPKKRERTPKKLTKKSKEPSAKKFKEALKSPEKPERPPKELRMKKPKEPQCEEDIVLEEAAERIFEHHLEAYVSDSLAAFYPAQLQAAYQRRDAEVSAMVSLFMRHAAQKEKEKDARSRNF
ncbi:hypothetical protein L596_020108 [Steinernema carpocapsae]|uniref:Uncharacterized protein n=1 Tax=Steinernema carpocapsae TaxID=34508 RepID=A0A4U5MSJ6_STECR|nr:hypothetical protein L596_020108 [Steinernema carpocapsae]